MGTEATRQGDEAKPLERLAGLLDVTTDELWGLEAGAAAFIADRVDHITRLAQFDELTGALRRGVTARALSRELSRANRRRWSLTVAFIDLDHLKHVNDAEGHAAGDALLKALASAFLKRLRPYDVVGRWGGDEFVCALPGCGRGLAADIVGSIRSEFERVTGHSFTAGFAEVTDQRTLDEVLSEADRELYRNKGARAPRAAGWLESPFGADRRKGGGRRRDLRAGRSEGRGAS